MKTTGAIVTPLMLPQQPGFLMRTAGAVRYAVTGQTPPWFGPLEPLPPVAPPEVAGRQFDYPVGSNVVTQPRAEEEISFRQLRQLADTYDLLRLVIETRKDQLAKMRWDIVRRDRADQTDPRIKQVLDLLAYPDREHGWDQWLRMLVEDMLVLDAATVYPRRARSGQLYALEPVDGATIKRVLDDHGRTPMPPDPAYQQILKGMPAVDYTTDELLYLPRNLRTNKIYGLGPVEQVVMSVNIAIRRQLHQLQFYTEGTVPDALVGLPETWSMDKVQQFQEYWDALLTDNTADRRKVRFVPGDVAKNFRETKPGVLKDEYDEWLARVVCYAFSVSPQWAVKQMNRATAETADEQAQSEGLAPLLTWIKGLIDRILTRVLGWPDLELLWLEDDEQDPLKQAQVNEVYLKTGVLNRNEVRAGIGLDPVKDGEIYLIYTATGAIPIEVAIAPPPPPPQIGHNGGPPLDDDGQQPDQAEQQEALAKAAARHDVRVDKMKTLWAKFFGDAAPRVAAALSASVGLSKAAEDGDPPVDEPPDGGDKTSGETTDGNAIDAAIDRVLGAEPWHHIETDSSAILQESATAAAGDAVAELAPGGSSATLAVDALNLANPRAVAAAQEQAADLVKGITETTRTQLRQLVVQAQDEGWSVARLGEAIEAADTFSPDRAFLIAKTELARSSIAGRLAGLRAGNEQYGLGLKKKTILGLNENHCPVCLAAHAEGAIPLDQGFVGLGDPPFHPNCGCGIASVAGGKSAADVASADQKPEFFSG